MTNKEFINLLMVKPLDATVNIDCGCCAHGTLYSCNSQPVISCDGGTYKTLSIRVNEGFNGECVNLENVSTELLLKEINKRCNMLTSKES